MAYFGVSDIIIAKLEAKTGTYTNGMVLEAVGTSVTPSYSEGSFYCDNALGRHRKMFKQADVTAEVGTIPLQAGAVMFGHTVSSEGGDEETSKTDDKANYCGYGFIGSESIDDDTDKFTACWLPRVLFTEGEDSFQTQNDSITFNSQKISGTAVGLSKADKTWRDKKQFATEAEALTWLKGKANITE